MIRTVSSALFALALALPCAAQYPDRALTIVAGFPAGGLVDIVSRVLADLWKEYKLHTVILRRIGLIKQ